MEGTFFASHGWMLTPRLPAASRMLRGLCLGLALGALGHGSPAGHRRLQEEEIPEFDFDFGPADRYRQGVWEIVTGYFYIKGSFLLNAIGDIAYAAREMLAGVCDTNLPTNVIARQDILTLNQPVFGLNMSFQILAPLGWAHFCAATLSFVGYGPSEGPFDEFEAPPIRPLVQAALAQYTTLDLDQIDYWAIEVGNVGCREALVSYGTEDAPPLLLERSTMPARWQGRDEPSPCGGALSVKWTPSSEVKYPWEDKPCLAAPTPCICASIRTCRYLPHPSGGKRCMQGWETENDFTRVDCEDCPYQADCPPTCKDAYTPCMCVWWNCTWDVGRSVCETPVAEAAPLSCLLCARQPHCEGLDIEEVQPPAWSLIGDDDVGWFINVTFNRPIMFGPLMQSTEQAIHMSCQSDAEAGLVPPVFIRFDLAAADVTIPQDTLFLDARKVPNPLRLRYCELKILEGALVDENWIPMADSWSSPIYLLGDMVAPTLQTWVPENSAQNIPLDAQVELKFSETVDLGLLNRTVSLLALGSYGTEGPADELVASFPAASPRLRFDAVSLKVNLGGLLKHDAMYSLGLDPDLVQDKAGNSFEGLPIGIYAFRTAPASYDHSGILSSSPVAGVVTLISLLVLFASATALGLLAWTRSRRARSGPNKVAPEAEAECQDLSEGHGEEDMQDLPAFNGVDTFRDIIEDLRSVHMCTNEKAKQEDVQAVTFQPQPDDSYYETFHTDELAGDSTVLEPDLTIVHKARPVSASIQRRGPEEPFEEEEEPTNALEVYEYYAFPPPWSAEDLACPPSRPRPVAPPSEPQLLELRALEDLSPTNSQVPAIRDDPDAVRMDSTSPSMRTTAAPTRRQGKISRMRPASAHQASKAAIKSLHDSLRSARPKPRLRRPQSAPSQRVQEKLMQSGAIVFRESDKRLPSYSAGNLDAEIRSRPASAARSRPQSAAQSRLAIGDGGPDPVSPLSRTLKRASSHQSFALARPSSAVSLGTSLGRLADGDAQPLPWDEVASTPDMVLETAPDGRERLRLLGRDEEMPPLRIIHDHTPSFKPPLSQLSARARSEDENAALQLGQSASSPSADARAEEAAGGTTDPYKDPPPELEAERPSESEESESEESQELIRGIGMPWAWQDGSFLKHQEQLFKDPNKERIFQVPKHGKSGEAPGSPLARRHRALGIRSRSSLAEDLGS